jgi:RimJ/RimL family protein N-acetyltransferase
MIAALVGADEAVIRWAVARFPESPTERCSAIGITRDGVIIAACIYNDFRRNLRGKPVDIRMTMVADNPRWARKGMIRILFWYPFKQLGVERATVVIARRNKRSRRLAEGLGFRLEGTARRGWDGVQDCMVYGMLRSECRWIGDLDGEERERGSGAA